ncbi:MAG: hypothetical protein C4294_17340 [Nitrospiraceae bacterium]
MYVKILEDPRHKNYRIIHIPTTNKRMFQNWSMGSVCNNQ